MNLLALRKKFVEISGRYDLVVDAVNFKDNGADFYLEQGQKSLERRLNITPTIGKLYKDYAAGTYLVQVANVRVIHNVWVLSVDGRKRLQKVDDTTIKAGHQAYARNMYTTPFATMDRGIPSIYFTTNLRRSPDDEAFSDSDVIQTFLETSSPFEPSLSGIVLLPPMDQSYGLEIEGLFYLPTLRNNTDENYWSVNYPSLLIMCALRQLEIMFAGSKSASAWDELIKEELLGLDMDAVEQECSDNTEMEG